MDRGCCCIQLLFLCIWLGLFPTFCISVNELTVEVQLLSPTGDVEEDDTVRLQCNATGMRFGYELEWWAYYSGSMTQITRNDECIVYLHRIVHLHPQIKIPVIYTQIAHTHI